MNIEDYLNQRCGETRTDESGVVWAGFAAGQTGNASEIGLALGRASSDDLIVELHVDQSYPSVDLGSLLSAANNWNRTHRLSRARVEPSAKDTDRSVIVLDAWLPTTAGVADETIMAFLDAVIADMLSFWSMEGGSDANPE